jgi:DNA topoisomerase-1
MVIKDGKFGPYVTDGETNASLRVGDDPTTLSPERGAELLQTRREAVANGTVGTKKAPAKKTAAKKTTTKKAPAKRTAAKKSGTKRVAKKAAGDGVASTVRRTVAKGASTRSKAGAKKATIVRSSAQRDTGIPGSNN